MPSSTCLSSTKTLAFGSLEAKYKSNDVRIFYKQCRSLQKHGFFVNLIAPNVKNQELEGVKIIGLKPIKENRFYRIFQLSKTAYQLAIETDADIYHFHDPELLRIGLKLRKKGKKRKKETKKDAGCVS